MSRLRNWAGEGLTFTAFGIPVLNSGMAMLPATLLAGRLASHGVLETLLHQGRLLEARWFPDELQLEGAHFGGEPVPVGPSAAEKMLAVAASESRTLSKAAAEQSLLQLYALYKQGTIGDVQGDRPGALDVVGRAKYDAWAAHKGSTQQQAIDEYVGLVRQLKAADQVE